MSESTAVSCSGKHKIKPTCLAGSVVPAGATPAGASTTYLIIVFPASSLSSVSAAARSGALKETAPAITQASQRNDVLRDVGFMGVFVQIPIRNMVNIHP